MTCMIVNGGCDFCNMTAQPKHVCWGCRDDWLTIGFPNKWRKKYRLWKRAHPGQKKTVYGVRCHPDWDAIAQRKIDQDWIKTLRKMDREPSSTQ